MPNTITPLTSGLLDVTIANPQDTTNFATGEPITNATTTADVYDPRNKKVATAVPMPHQGSGIYRLTIDPLWSRDNVGRPVIGEFVARIFFTFPAGQGSEQECWTTGYACD